MQTDWQVLSSQTVESIFKLESTACDPVAARLIDETDASYLFHLFFSTRNPLLGLLDPELHTPEYVYTLSFTLFSAICALGCAISSRPRDRVIYAALLSLAEANMKWSIAVSVRSLETIQAIILMQYWAPMCTRHSCDPAWLHLSHAAQLARELGIYETDRIDKYVAASVPVAADEKKERFRRNIERTWLYIFIADKSFGLINGRRLSVSWNELPPDVYAWWQNPMATAHDRMISGIVETRGILLDALKEGKNGDMTLLSVFKWHSRWFETLEHVRGVRCTPDASPSSVYLPLLAFYMDHNILVLNAQAIAQLAKPNDETTSPELEAVYQKTVKVATRTLNSVLNDPMMVSLRLGFHNNQYIMICHAVAEVVQATKKNLLSIQETADAASYMRAIPEHLDKIAQQLPVTSLARMYASLSRCLMLQLNKDIVPVGERSGSIVSLFNSSSAPWRSWETSLDGFDPASLSLEQMMLDMGWDIPFDAESDTFLFPQQGI
ncbi:hypothetical protein NXS19_011306 [Fusarium pseudograminearum]|nr:hypothetical protein NXS19_011306 [Fusarium pseudograminearum]